MDPTVAERQLDLIWPLSRSFEYAAEAGLSLAMRHGKWFAEFQRSHPGYERRYPLLQAQGFQFLSWLEREFAADGRSDILRAHVLGALLFGAPRLQTELEASADAAERSWEGAGDDDNPPERLSGGEVRIVTAAACIDYQGTPLDRWSTRAFDGADLERRSGGAASIDELSLVHDRRYLADLISFARAGGGPITPETLVEPASEPAMLSAAGSLRVAVDWALEDRRGDIVLAQVHPGSHHAGIRRGGGTCLINNIAYAAAHARRQHRLPRVAILDIDAHHGNGTEEIFLADHNVLCLSIHQRPPFFPGTGSRSQRGAGRGEGANFNFPVDPADGAAGWHWAADRALRRLQAFRPQLVLVELSTDAHHLDPVSDLVAGDDCFAEIGERLRALGTPIVAELGASLSEAAWVRGLRAFCGLS